MSLVPQLIVFLGHMDDAAALLVLYFLVDDGAENTAAGKITASSAEIKSL
ncbi:hypothetical protein [Vreelandella olivaria]|nr:hypothetical protein [Halomonas olivaria]